MIVVLVFAVCYMLFWGGIILFALPKNQVFKKSKYDERQRAEQGKAFQYAYITLLCYLIMWMAADKLFGTDWCEMTFGLFLGIGFSVSVFLAYCIFRDAYFSVGEHKAGAQTSRH